MQSQSRNAGQTCKALCEMSRQHARTPRARGRPLRPFRSYRRQKGAAPFAEGILALLFWATGIFVALTVLVPALVAVKLRSKVLGLCVVAIASFWVYVFLTRVHLPSQRQEADRNWRSGAWSICKQEQASLPARVLGRSLLDEAAGLNREQVVQLLSERGLEFLEIRPALQAREAPRVALSGTGGQGDESWRLPGLALPYVRLRLGSTVDPKCNPALNRYGTLGMPPFLPDTCLTVEPIEHPSAELALALEPASSEQSGPYGSRKLLQRDTQQILARLTTSETEGQTGHGAGDRLTRPSDSRRDDDCRKPHRLLADLVTSPDSDWLERSNQVLKVEKVKALRSLEQILSEADRLPSIQAESESHAYLTDSDQWDVFSRTIRSKEWAHTVASARGSSTHTAPYGPRLLDLGKGSLIELDHGWPDPWKAHALLDGFFLVKDYTGWDRFPRNLLVRFRRDGQFEWAIAIAPPATQSNEPMRWPQAIYLDGPTLVLADRGRVVKSEDAAPPGVESLSPRWELPLASLPAMHGFRP